MNRSNELPNFNFDRTSELSSQEITEFVESNIWCAAVYFWGPDFYNPRMPGGSRGKSIPLDTPSKESQAIIDFYLNIPKNYHKRAIRSTKKASGRAGLSVDVGMDVLRDDLTDILPRDNEGVTVWDLLSYTFPLDDGQPTVYHSYILEDEKGAEITNPSRSQRIFLEWLQTSERFSLDREPSLNRQDCIIIHNILLALEVPEEYLSLPDFE